MKHVGKWNIKCNIDQETVQSSGSELGSLILFTFLEVRRIKLLLLGFKFDEEVECDTERELSPNWEWDVDAS